MIADGLGRAIAFRIAPGQAHELPDAIPLLNSLSDVPAWVVADRGYSSHSFREYIWSLGARPAIPAKSNEAPVACPDWIYTNRNVVERLWARLKEWRAVATRYEKTASSFMGVLRLAAAIELLLANLPPRHRQQIAFTVMALARCHNAAEALPVARAQALRDDEVERLPQRLVGTIIEDPLGAGVPHADDPIMICRYYGVSSSGKDGFGNKSGWIHLRLPSNPRRMEHSDQGTRSETATRWR